MTDQERIDRMNDEIVRLTSNYMGVQQKLEQREQDYSTLRVQHDLLITTYSELAKAAAQLEARAKIMSDDYEQRITLIHGEYKARLQQRDEFKTLTLFTCAAQVAAAENFKEVSLKEVLKFITAEYEVYKSETLKDAESIQK